MASKIIDLLEFYRRSEANAAMLLKYVGIKKHKRWTPGGANGSICPDWTHSASGRHFGASEPEQWDRWPQTLAQRLLAGSVAHGNQRYAAARGIAFCGQVTPGGTWHGYPILWRDVPDSVRGEIEAAGQVTSREIIQGIRRQRTVDPKRNLRWAIETDER
jgi:hypothetical protein